MFNKNTERFTEAAVQNVESTKDLIQTSLESIEKIAKLNLTASRQFVEEASQAVKEIASVSNPTELFERINHLATHTVENGICNCRDLYEVITDVQNKMGKLLEAKIGEAQKNLSDAVDGLSQLGTPRNSTVQDSLRSWTNGMNQALNTLNKMAVQVSEFTNNNIKAATNATVSAVKKTSTTKK